MSKRKKKPNAEDPWECCPARSDKCGEVDTHCDCWWDGDRPCCACGAGADGVPNLARRARKVRKMGGAR